LLRVFQVKLENGCIRVISGVFSQSPSQFQQLRYSQLFMMSVQVCSDKHS